MCVLAWMVTVMFILPSGIRAEDAVQPQQAEDAAQQQQTEAFKKEELAQMLAPIALYPDSLIATMLMASTYPIEVVEAERWLRQNANLKGDELDKALLDMEWDPSVKSLCHYPDILFSMSDKLDQTRKLGDAFLSQEGDVMATIQELRQKARDQGNLSTTKEQKVIVEEDFIRIEPVDPLVVYVPVYDPFYVYGPWWYPGYPPYYWYYPPGFVLSGGYFGFGYGFYLGIGVSSWAWFDWHNHHIRTDYHKTKWFHRERRSRKNIDSPFWRHDPTHRRGVSYRDRTTSERFVMKPSGIATAGPGKQVQPKGIQRQTAPAASSAGVRQTAPSMSGSGAVQGRSAGPPAPSAGVRQTAPSMPGSGAVQGRSAAPPAPSAGVRQAAPPVSGSGAIQGRPSAPPSGSDTRGQDVGAGRQGGTGYEGRGFQGSGGGREPGMGGGFRR